MEQKIPIIMVTYNRREFTRKVLDFIAKRTRYPYEVIVVDNNSTDGTREMLLEEKARGRIKMIVNMGSNMGLEKALSAGLNFVDSEYFVTVDNDCLCPDLFPCWLERLESIMNFNPVYDAIALRPQVLIGVGTIFNTTDLVVKNNVCGGSFRIMRTKNVKKVGGWTDKFENDGRGNEEHDICSKLRGARGKVGYTRKLFCYHMFGNEGTWGYDKKSDFRMGRSRDMSPMDQEFDLKTCEPKIRSNE